MSIQVPKAPALLIHVETADEVGIGVVWRVVDAAAIVVPDGIGITWRLVSEGRIGITWRLVSPAVVVPESDVPKPKQTVSRGAVID